MKKILCLLGIFIMSLNIPKVMAYTFEVSATSYSVTAGNTITLNISVNDAAGKFNISSSDAGIVSVSTSSVWIDNSTQSVTLQANREGNATIYVNANDVTTYDGESVSITKQVNISVNPKPSINNNTNTNTNSNTNITPRAKSSNNFLSSLTIDGLKLKEEFDKEKLEYTLDVPAETEKIKINAQLADSNATITGTGEVKLTSGINTFEIIVTAENGSKRTYVIKATLLELDPLEVKIDNIKYTIIRKRKDLPEISEYNTPKDITIDNNIVEGYYNEKLKYNIVGLKDENGKIKYYIYNNGKYSLYNEQTFNGTTLQILDKKMNGYKETSFTYNKIKIPSYQEVKSDLIKNTYALEDGDIEGNQFYLFYAINVETGKEYLYQYDALEKTVQRYNMQVLDMYKDHNDKYYLALLVSILALGVITVIFSILFIKSKKKK